MRRILKESSEALERKFVLRRQGCDLEWLIDRVAEEFQMRPEELVKPGKYPVRVAARSVLCHWATRELGLTTVELAKRLGLSQPAISQATRRGERIVAERGLSIVPEQKDHEGHRLLDGSKSARAESSMGKNQ